MYHIVCDFPHFTETTQNVKSKHRELKALPVPVMWSETVGLLGQDRSQTKKSVLVLVLHAVVSVLVLQV